MEITLRAPAVTPPPSARPPVGALTPDEVLALHDELLAYYAEFAPHFRRAEQRRWALKYTEGQLLPLERKSIAPLADALDGGNVQAMQHRPGGTRRPRGLGRRRGAGHASASRGRDAGRPGDGRAHRRWVRLPQTRDPLGGGGPAVLRRAGQGGALPGECGRHRPGGTRPAPRVPRWWTAACMSTRTGLPRRTGRGAHAAGSRRT